MLSRITRVTSTRLLGARTLNHNYRFMSTKPTDETQVLEEEPSTPTTKQGRANEIIEAVLYGSKKIKEIERQTHSKVLARGKYVHELQSKYIIV
jgi:hypothetical protein